MDINLYTNISKEYKEIELILNAPEMTENVKQILNKVMQIINHTEQIIASRDNKNYIFSINEIICFYTEDKYTYCKTKEGDFRIKERLYELENVLESNFVRISNSCIINLKYVKCFDSTLIGTIEVTFKDGTKEYVSRRKVSQVMKKIKEWRD